MSANLAAHFQASAANKAPLLARRLRASMHCLPSSARSTACYPQRAARTVEPANCTRLTLIVEEAVRCEAVASVALGCREARADQGSKNGAHNIADLE